MNKYEFAFEVWGDYAQFSDPILKRGGEKVTYEIPTYEALVNLTKGIYWKPTFDIVIEKVRIMNPILMQCKGMNVRPLKTTLNDQSSYVYLYKPRYKVLAKIVWNENRPDLDEDRCIKKHMNIMNRKIKTGARHNIFLGTSECGAYIKATNFEEDEGYYDNEERRDFPLMYYGFIWPSMSKDKNMKRCFWKPCMRHGVIEYGHPENAPIKEEIGETK